MSSSAVRPDPSRVIGIATALSAHIAVGMLLLIGLSPMWDPPVAPNEPMETVWIPNPPPPPAPAMPVAPTRPTLLKPERVPPVVPRIPVPELTVPQPMMLPTISEPLGMSTSVPTDVPSTVESVATPSALAYAFAPPPTYPHQALRRGESGTVWLRVEVDAQGRPTNVTVHESSGSKALDLAARKQVLQRWRFVPARQGDQAVAAVGLVPIVFTPAG